MKKLIISLSFLVLAPLKSFSAAMGSNVLFEPTVGYRTESLKLTNLSQNETQFKTSTPVYGVKLGFRSLIGVDLNLAGQYSAAELEVSNMTEKNKYTHQTASAELGVSALGLMKIYLGYSFMNEFNVQDSSQLQGFKLSGPAYLAGLQLKLVSLVNLGFQYNLNQFNKITGPNYTGSDSTESYFSKVDSQDYSVYLSVSF